MKVVILAGGLGTRISEESQFRPKPMVEIGDMPILWHIMKIYSYYGHNEFIICCGYKGYMIKEYFADYYLRKSDVTFDFTKESAMKIHSTELEPWKVTLVNTGLDTMTGGRLARIKDYLKGDETFLMTYGDGVSNVNINELIEFHKSKNSTATMTVVQPAGRYGAVSISDEEMVKTFIEKPIGDGGWVNAGFFVLDRDVFNYIDSDQDIFEKEPLSLMAKKGRLSAYKHSGYWQSMDSLREKNILENDWNNNRAKWKVWE